jgi:hypothetical protein
MQSVRTEDADMSSKKLRRSIDELTALDAFLAEEGKLKEFEIIAIKEVLAWQVAEERQAHAQEA